MAIGTKSVFRRAVFLVPAVAVVVAMVAGGVVLANQLAPRSEAEASARVLDDATRMGAVELTTRDLAPMREFYVDAVGLEVLDETDDLLRLGAGGVEVIRLSLDESAAPAPVAEAGLYHSAILFPDRASLAQSLVRVASVAPASYQGSADHAVSLAFYFGDPDGNGVELYVDRPRDEWRWVDGQVVMDSAALDPQQFIEENMTGDAAPATMGHVHLKVGELENAERFYADVLGFDVTSRIDGAIFMSAGGYHHHLAANTWGSSGAGQRTAGQGLAAFTVVLANETELDEMAARLTTADLAFTRENGEITVPDPWGNLVRFTVDDSTGN